MRVEIRAKSSHPRPRSPRADFWLYCKRSVPSAKVRAAKRGVPYAITAHDIDRLLVDQGWRCAISGIVLDRPNSSGAKPFGPSLDRIRPENGYVVGNIRVVCNMVNWAMNKWGEKPLRELLRNYKNSRA